MDTKAQRKAEKEARKQAERETREAERQRQENERQWAEFWATPVGQARAAREGGDVLFQISLPVRDTRRTALPAMTHNMQTATKERTGHGELLSAIEKEGWTLIHAGFVFEQHGQASRDKFLASGQQVAIDGQTVGVYVFRAASNGATRG
ncbi:MAG: hypothetical protein M3O70_15220 [Actinomycetota bacterium]|nr:hypothetical protein [Actinomycetota bacterium]